MKKHLGIILLLTLGIGLLIISAFLAYKEWAPQDDSAATIYYLSPTGNDSTGNGTNGSPWKTLDKANSSINPGDTVILKDGEYSGYFGGITKSNTTWRAENRHKAIIDGGFGPELLQGRWENVKDAFNRSTCKSKPAFPYVQLITIKENTDNVTIDGLTLRNSCGRAIWIGGDNNIIQNTRIDWTLIQSIYIERYTRGNKILNNIITRATFNDMWGYYMKEPYGVNVSMYMKGDDMEIRNNIIAWGRGELATDFARNMIFEDNILVGNKNNLYIGWTQNSVFRNNLLFSPETSNTANTHWAWPEGLDTVNWRMSSRAEHRKGTEGLKGPINIQFYNNISINNDVGFDGYHRKRIIVKDTKVVERCYGHIFNGLYYGHNTIIAREDAKNLFVAAYTPCSGTLLSADSTMTGVIENNIFDNSKNRNLGVRIDLNGNDNLLIRNNIFPVGTRNYGNNNIYTNNPEFNATIEQLKILNLRIPGIGVSMEEVDSQDLRNLVDLNKLRLKQNSPAINAGTTADSPNSAIIPSEVRSRDYLRNSRNGIPDIGAMEYGGVYNTSTPTPIQSATPTPTPSQTPGASLTPTLTQTPGASLTPTPRHTATPTPILSPTPEITYEVTQTLTPSPTPSLTGNICGKADVDNNGIFDINDFTGFAQMYGDGKKSCGDSLVDYGPCRGRDADRNGLLDINDFGGYGIGFAQRYYPKTSCALD